MQYQNILFYHLPLIVSSQSKTTNIVMMKYADSVESVTHLEGMVIQELKNLGIKVPKPCKRPRAESATFQVLYVRKLISCMAVLPL